MRLDNPNAIIDYLFANQTLDLEGGARVQLDSRTRGDAGDSFKYAAKERVT